MVGIKNMTQGGNTMNNIIRKIFFCGMIFCSAYAAESPDSRSDASDSEDALPPRSYSMSVPKLSLGEEEMVSDEYRSRSLSARFIALSLGSKKSPKTSEKSSPRGSPRKREDSLSYNIRMAAAYDAQDRADQLVPSPKQNVPEISPRAEYSSNSAMGAWTQRHNLLMCDVADFEASIEKIDAEIKDLETKRDMQALNRLDRRLSVDQIKQATGLYFGYEKELKEKGQEKENLIKKLAEVNVDLAAVDADSPR